MQQQVHATQQQQLLPPGFDAPPPPQSRAASGEVEQLRRALEQAAVAFAQLKLEKASAVAEAQKYAVSCSELRVANNRLEVRVKSLQTSLHTMRKRSATAAAAATAAASSPPTS
jgi:hypothetical protein